MSAHKSNAPVSDDVKDAQNNWSAFTSVMKVAVISIAVILGLMAIVLV